MTRDFRLRSIRAMRRCRDASSILCFRTGCKAENTKKNQITSPGVMVGTPSSSRLEPRHFQFDTHHVIVAGTCPLVLQRGIAAGFQLAPEAPTAGTVEE